MRNLVFVIAMLSAGTAHAQLSCPANTYPWVDGWGNNTCREFGTNRDAVTEVNPQTGMPTGAMPSMDKWGNQTSEGTGSTAGTTYYDTSKGCPVGTYSWTDTWGNPTCKAF